MPQRSGPSYSRTRSGQVKRPLLMMIWRSYKDTVLFVQDSVITFQRNNYKTKQVRLGQWAVSNMKMVLMTGRRRRSGVKTDGQGGESSPHLISLSTLYYSSLFQYDGHCGELLPHIRLYSLPSGELFQYILFGTQGRTSLWSWSISGPHLSEMK